MPRWGFWGAALHPPPSQPCTSSHQPLATEPGTVGEGDGAPWESHPAVSMATPVEQGAFCMNQAAYAPQPLSDGSADGAEEDPQRGVNAERVMQTPA